MQRKELLFGGATALASVSALGTAGATMLLRSPAVSRNPLDAFTITNMNRVGITRIDDPFTSKTYLSSGAVLPYRRKYGRSRNGLLMPMNDPCPQVSGSVAPLDQNCCENDCDSGTTTVNFVVNYSGGSYTYPNGGTGGQDSMWTHVITPFWSFPVLADGPVVFTPKQLAECIDKGVAAIAACRGLAIAIGNFSAKFPGLPALPAIVTSSALRVLAAWGGSGLGVTAAADFIGGVLAALAAPELVAVLALAGVTASALYLLWSCFG